MFKSASGIKDSAIAQILAVRQDLSTLDGEPHIDIIDAFSVELSKLWFFADYLEKLNSVSGLQSIIDDDSYKSSLATALGVSYTSLTIGTILGVPSDIPNDVEAILYYDINRMAADYGLTRKDPVYGTGVERFFVNGPSAVTLPLGSRVTTAGSNQIIYVTFQNVVGVIPGYDPTTNSYYVDVSIVANVAGASSNVILNSLVVQQPATTGVVRVTNLTTIDNGRDRESNDDLLDRILTARSGMSIDTREGYRNWADGQPGVVDSNVVGAGDSLMLRAPSGGVDIYILGESLQSISVTYVVGNPGETFVFPNQPVMSVTSVVGLRTYNEGDGYHYVQDTGGRASSAKAYTILIFDPIVGPGAGETLTITFVYDAMVKRLQDILDSDESVNVPGSDVLVKRANKWYVFSQIRMVPAPGFSPAAVQTAIQSTLTTFMQAYSKLNKGLNYSDFYVAVAETKINGIAAVDRIDGLLIGRSSDITVTPALSEDDLPAAPDDYYVLGPITFI